MKRDELFDKILTHLYENPDSFWIIPTWCERTLKISDHKLIDSIVDELLERKWTTPKKGYKYSQMISFEGQQMFEKHRSYSSFLNSEKVSQKKIQRRQTTPTVIQIGITIIFGVSTACLGWFKYFDNKTIQNQSIQIDNLTRTIDSLKTELKTAHNNGYKK